MENVLLLTQIEELLHDEQTNGHRICSCCLKPTIYWMGYGYVKLNKQANTIGSEVHHTVHNITIGMLCIKLFSNK